MRTEKLYFRVDFEGLTRQLRDFWAEGSYKHAIDYGKGCGLTKELTEEVIRGKYKMVQDPDGRDGVDGMLAKDDWTPNLNMCHHCKYPDPNELYEIAEQTFELKETVDYARVFNLWGIAEEISLAYKDSDMATARDLWNIVDTFPKEIREQVDIPYSRALAEMTEEEYENAISIEKAKEKKMAELVGIPSIGDYINQELEREKRPTPKPTKNLKWDNGWLLPNGNFYPCEGGTMEHIWLADRLGKTENEAEQAGWIKLGKGMLGIHICAFKKPTKKQFNFLFDWSEFKKDRQKEYENFIKFNCFADD
jgi:heat shock protein HspQ